MVIALDKYKRPLGFLTERRCRKLMEQKRAVTYRMFPMVVIVKDVDSRTLGELPAYRIKIDPGAKYTGIAIVRDDTSEFMFGMQVEHRAQAVKAGLDTRRACRRNRRSRETGYRKAKWGNKCTGNNGKNHDSPREEGWLPPSVKSAADNILTWAERLSRWINIKNCSFEAVRFDTQKMEDPEIEGTNYQHGTLFGYEIKEYLLDVFGHECQYCGGKSGDPFLEWEHIHPRSRGGSDSIKNATLACSSCNRDKGNHTLPEWKKIISARLPKERGAKKELDEERLKLIQNVIDGKAPHKGLRYAIWVSSARKYTEKALFQKFEEVECSSGGRTKYNRTELDYPKEHHYDALCVGNVPEKGFADRTHGYCLYAKAMGRGNRLRGQINKCGVIICKYKNNHKDIKGFMTGDIVAVDIPQREKHPLKYEGHHIGRVMVRASGNFDIRTTDGERIGANVSYCRLIQKNDGYEYHPKNIKGNSPR